MLRVTNKNGKQKCKYYYKPSQKTAELNIAFERDREKPWHCKKVRNVLEEMMEDIDFRFDKELPEDQVIALYKALKWSSAEKPKELLKALANSHSVLSAWDGQKLIGLANSISDGYLVVYYPHLLVMPEYQGRGIGKALVLNMKNKYCDFHQQILVADGNAISFYKSCGFNRAGSCEPLWVYKGHDHD